MGPGAPLDRSLGVICLENVRFWGEFAPPLGPMGRHAVVSSIWKKPQNAILLEKQIENHGFGSSAAVHFHLKNY